MEPTRYIGTITRVIPNRGFGFVRAENGKSHFFHAKQMVRIHDFDTLREGQCLSFESLMTEDGLRAIKIEVVKTLPCKCCHRAEDLCHCEIVVRSIHQSTETYLWCVYHECEIN